jgi:hypothetical protein
MMQKPYVIRNSDEANVCDYNCATRAENDKSGNRACNVENNEIVR